MGYDYIVLMPLITGRPFTRKIFGLVLLLLCLEEKLISSRKQVVISRGRLSLRRGSSHHQGTRAEVEVDIWLSWSHLATSDGLRQFTPSRAGGPPTAAAAGGSQSDDEETKEKNYNGGRHEDEGDAEEVERWS